MDGWLTGQLAGWLADWLVGWLTGPPAGWRAGWLTGWLAVLLAGGPAGCLRRFGFGVFCGRAAIWGNLGVVLGLEIQFCSFRGLAGLGTFFLPGSGRFCETVAPNGPSSVCI